MGGVRIVAAAARIMLLSLLLSLGSFSFSGSSGTLVSAKRLTSFPVNTWEPTAGPMPAETSGQSAILLNDGDVLIAGGDTASAELYDPATRRFRPTGRMSVARPGSSVTRLESGDVLVAGGCCSAGHRNLSTAEIYDPVTGTWSSTGPMNEARSGQTATLLQDGMVLVAGGWCSGDGDNCKSGSFLTNQRTAELYDPTTRRWSTARSMHDGRALATSTLLPDGDVLVAGGLNNCDDDFCSDLDEAELYNPATNQWAQTGSFKGPRQEQSATLLKSGSVLLAGGLSEGGDGGNSHPYATASIYDPSTGVWTSTASMPDAHYGQLAAALSNGWVLLAGGQSSDAEIYEPSRRLWVETGALNSARTNAASVVLPDGDVLAAGGLGPDKRPQDTAEVYVTGRGPLVSSSARTLYLGGQLVGTTGLSRSFTLSNYGDSELSVSGISVSGPDPGDFTASDNCTHGLIAVGSSCQISVRFAPGDTGLRNATVSVVDNAPLSPQGTPVDGYGAGPDAFSPTGSMSVGRYSATSTLLPDGDVLIAGGENRAATPLSECEIYDPRTGEFAVTGPLHVARAGAAATLLDDGDVLMVGGRGPDLANLKSAEIYDPKKGLWSLTTPMDGGGSFGINSTLLEDGDVLVDGIDSGVEAEVYDPTSGTWTATGPTIGRDYGSVAILLSTGDVLVTGDGSASAELYDPTTNEWSATGSMNVARYRPVAALLPTGDVLVAGGAAPNGTPLASAELYDPATATWVFTEGALPSERYGGTATLLEDGDVLLEGGCTSDCGPSDSSSTIYEDGFFEYGPPMTEPRVANTATLMQNGEVLVAGGNSNICCSVLRGAEIYTSTVVSVTPSSGPPGQQITITGKGYFAGEHIDIVLDGQTRLGSTTSTSSGTFVLHATIPLTESSGDHTIQASGSRSFASAQAVFTVT